MNANREISLWKCLVGWAATILLLPAFFPAPLAAEEPAQGPYARIGILRPHDGDTVDFEAGYIRHLDWHRKAGDRWTWYGWTISIGERQRSLVYATFGHSADDLSHPVDPAGDERDTIPNITPHCHFDGNIAYEFLPALSRGSGVPAPTPRVEYLQVQLAPGTEEQFEKAVAAERSGLKGETLWYRAVQGGALPSYIRLRPRPTLADILGSDLPLPNPVSKLVTKTTSEVWTLRPALSIGVEPAPGGGAPQSVEQPLKNEGIQRLETLQEPML